MRIIVCMKQIGDLAQLRFKSDGRTPVAEGLPPLLGAFDKNALEAAVQIKEAREEVEVIALSAGTGKLQETIKEALAIGADRAALVIDPALGSADVSASARVLAAAVSKLGGADLILLGEGSDDEYTGQIPARLAGILGLPQITVVRELEILQDGRVRASRDLETQLEVLECEPPVLVSVTSELNTPRLPPLSAILKAGRKPIEIWSLSDLELGVEDLQPQIEIIDNLAPKQARKNVILEGGLSEQLQVLLRELEHEGVLS